jgi:alpha-glucosidase
MQWTGAANAGFTSGTPWLPIDDDYPVVNVESEIADQTSILALYHRLILLRRKHAPLAYGDYRAVAMTGDLIAYIREFGGHRLLMALNLGTQPYAVSLMGALGAAERPRIVLSTHLDREGEIVTGEVNLRADEGIIVALEPDAGPSP